MSITLHPEFEKLKNKLSDLILTYNELTLRICPNLEIKNLQNFGILEYELYKKDINLSILKRKLKLIQIQINNEEQINMDLINAILEKEFLEYKENIKKQMTDLEKVIKLNFKSVLSKKDMKKLKKIYKECVLKLHPDLNKNLTEHEKDLFLQVTEAFKNADLDTLESLYYLIPNGKIEPISESDRLQELITLKEKQINEIKEKYPYNKKELIFNPEKKQKYISELENLIDFFDEEIKKYDKKIINLI